MKRSFLLAALMVFCWINMLAQQSNPFEYVNPKPSSSIVSPETNLILRAPAEIRAASLSGANILVEGSESGMHAGELVLSDDHRAIVFNPEVPFAANESVKVTIPKGIQLKDGSDIPGYQYGFSIASEEVFRLPSSATYEIDYSLPPPTITIDSINDPSPGNIFVATWDRNVPAKYGNFVFILDKNGGIVDSVRVKGAPFDFQLQQNGLLTFALGDYSINVPLPGEELQHIVMDQSLTVVDSFKMKNGYLTDFHEFKMLPNGHAVMMSYHNTTCDMSKVVEGGRPDATLVINIIQEQDRNKNVVWEWRNIDHIPITDSDLDLTAPRSNYSTLNGFEIDTDGHILASFRNHSEIMKISRVTGEILWRMGSPRGEFSYEGENEKNAPYYHARQHDIRRLPNGNISIFDNGQFHLPPYSRAVEYSIDEENKTATLVDEWIYPGEKTIFCVTAGNAQRLSGGGWFIGFGVPNPQFLHRNMVEVHPDGSIALEASLPKGILAYRAYKFPFRESTNMVSYMVPEVQEGNTYTFNNETIKTGVDIHYNALLAADYNESTITRVPYGPQYPEFIENLVTVYPVSIGYEGLGISTQSAEVRVDLSIYPEIFDPGNVAAYYRATPGEGLFVPRPTSYDSTENEMVFSLSGFGEIVFLVADAGAENQIPILFEPLDEQKLLPLDAHTLRWTGLGYYHSFNIQVSTSLDFTDILAEENSNLSDYTVSGLMNNMTYYWRVNSVLEDEAGEWSETWSFSLTDPYISMGTPDGGETYESGDTTVIRWETNIADSVVVGLLENDLPYLSLDTVPGALQAYIWNISAELMTSHNYKIQVTSMKDEGISGVSAGEFAIVDSTVIGMRDLAGWTVENVLDQNYPNPFTTSTRISYTTAQAGRVQLKVYNLLGQEVISLVDEVQTGGRHSVEFHAGSLPEGSYFYRLQAGEGFSEVRKMVLTKE